MYTNIIHIVGICLIKYDHIVRASHYFDLHFPFPCLDSANKYFLDYVQNVWKNIRCPAYNVVIAYIYIERYIKCQNEKFPF